MNKTKRVAWHKHLAKAKKLRDKAHAVAHPQAHPPVRPPRPPVRSGGRGA